MKLFFYLILISSINYKLDAQPNNNIDIAGPKMTYVFNNKVFMGNLTHLNLDSVYLVLVEPMHNKLFNDYYPETDGLIFIYTKDSKVCNVTKDFLDDYNSSEENTLYKLDNTPFTTQKTNLDSLLLDIKSITVIKDVNFYNFNTCKSDFFTLFVINTGKIYEKGVSEYKKIYTIK